MAFETTPAHEAIFAAIRAKKTNIIIEAVAGSGKTTTICEALKLVPTSEKCVFLAFNASIAKELGRRVPSHVEARTMNSLGHRAWSRYAERELGVPARSVKVDADKVRRILWDWEDQGKVGGEAKSIGSAACKLVRLAKSQGLVPSTITVDGKPVEGLLDDDVTVWEALIDNFDVDLPESPTPAGQAAIAANTIELARRLLDASCRQVDIIDFDDQIYLPYVYDIDCFRFDRVFVDEAQDLSPLQHDLLRRSLKANGQLVAVGDPCQAIYGFRGADAKSMDTLRESFKAEKLPLHVSYRCPQAVVAAAQTVVAHIQAHASAPEGVVDMTPVMLEKADLRGGDLVVCRTTAPVVAAAYSMIRRGIPTEVLGRDIGKGLETLIKKLNAYSVDDLLAKLDKWEQKETERAMRKGAEGKVTQIEDKCETIRVLAEGQTSVGALLDTIASLFSGEPSASRVTFSTVHKAKGLEADRVFVLNRHLMPHRMARQAWQKEQEKNLIYVAYTRAKKELRALLGPDGKSRAA